MTATFLAGALLLIGCALLVIMVAIVVLGAFTGISPFGMASQSPPTVPPEDQQ